MKKLIILSLGICALAITSCGTTNVKTKAQLAESGTLQDTVDLVPYVLGVDIGNNLWNGFDSTLNIELICQGIMDAYGKKDTEFTATEAQEIIQKYMYEIKPKLEAEKMKPLAEAFLKEKAALEGMIKSETGLLYQITKTSNDKRAEVGDTVKVHYTLYDMEGNKIESSLDRGQPMPYVKGQTQLIAGFVEGLEMLGEGGKASLYIPAELGYGEQGAGAAIKPGAPLQFDIEVLSITTPSKKK